MSSFNYSEKLFEFSSSQISLQSISSKYEEDIEEIGIAAEKQQLSQYFEDYLEQTNINIQVIQEIVISKKAKKNRQLTNKQLKSLSNQLKFQGKKQQLLKDSWNRAIQYPCCRECCANEKKENDFVSQNLIEVTQLKEATNFMQETVVSLNLISNQQNIGTNNDLVDQFCKKIVKIEESQLQYIQPYLYNQQQDKWQ